MRKVIFSLKMLKTWTEEATQIDSDEESTQSEEHIVELLSDEEDYTQGVLRSRIQQDYTPAMDKSRIIQSDLDRLPTGTPQEPADRAYLNDNCIDSGLGMMTDRLKQKGSWTDDIAVLACILHSNFQKIDLHIKRHSHTNHTCNVLSKVNWRSSTLSITFLFLL